MRKRAFETGRVDELQTAKAAQFRQLHGDQVDMFGVFGIFLFGNVGADLVDRDLGIAAIVVMNARLFAGAVADFGDHGGNRHDTYRKDIAADEMVQETAFAGLEPSQHGDADFVLVNRGSCAGKKARERGNLVARRDLGGQVQGRRAGTRRERAVGFGVNVLRRRNHSSSNSRSHHSRRDFETVDGGLHHRRSKPDYSVLSLPKGGGERGS